MDPHFLSVEAGEGSQSPSLTALQQLMQDQAEWEESQWEWEWEWEGEQWVLEQQSPPPVPSPTAQGWGGEQRLTDCEPARLQYSEELRLPLVQRKT